MIQIPDKKGRFTQTNESDILGNLFSTFNCDFSNNVGALRLGKTMLLNSPTDAAMSFYPAAFKAFDDGSGVKMYTIAGSLLNQGFVFRGGSDPTQPFTKMTTPLSPSFVDSELSDMETFNNVLFVTPSSSNCYYYNGTTWTAVATGSASTYPRPLCRADFITGSRLYTVINGYQIVSTDNSYNFGSGSFTISVDVAANRQIITFMKAASNRIWIGTVNVVGGEGRVYEWDGSSATFQNIYKMPSAGAISCVIKDDVPYVIDSNGSLLRWNGGTFVRETGFNRLNNKPFYNQASPFEYRFIHRNGMAVIAGRINILANLSNNDGTANDLFTINNGTQEYCNPSGVWEYNETLKELKHKQSIGLNSASSSMTDRGQFRVFGVGAISEFLTNKDAQFSTYDGQFLVGASYYTNATALGHGVFYDNAQDTKAKAGYFITTKINPQESLKESWHRAYVNHLRFLNQGADKMVVKYRTVIDTPTETTITWTNNTSFTSTTDLSVYVVGDEVEIVQGTGSGFCAHIASMSGNSITLDETIPGVSSTAVARFSKWKKAGVIQDTVDFNSVPLAQQSPWIQLKVWMSWTGQNELNNVVITNTPSAAYQ